MVEGSKLGFRDINGVISKQTVEAKLLPKLKEKLGYEITFSHYQSRVKWFKKQYTNYSQLMGHSSGFGWDPITKRFTADDEVWADYLKSHPTHGHFRSETFPDYEDLKIAVGNGTATGMGSISLGDDTDATTFGAEENESWGIGGIDGLVFDRNTNMFVQSENESSQQPSQGTSIDAPAPPHSRTQGKRSRTDYENNSGSKGATGQAEVLENLSSGIGKIVTSFDKICGLMEKRESRESDLLDAMKETPGLTDEACFMALDLLNTKAKQDFFLKMTPEQRLNWITYKQMQ
ncbi:putative Myb/SANT-like domain-containing protein [Rosa chinensis]|uniref:Putative Myb/SANT-like domain-containing protein n=2 Tax=Rosa chinensis TaxID=74649 RepID=A0A2P6PTI1_ROSCH|nr:putative Myb/SANT-like domain-containing protein [Rosa chinensis]